MSHYSKVSPRFWTGTTGRALRGSPNAQVVATYLISSPHANMLGYYYLPIAYIANDTGIPIEGASEALQRLCEEGFCRYDRGSEVVWIVEMAKFQVEESLKPKDLRCKAINREYRSMPNNTFLQEFYERYGAAFNIEKARAFEAPSKPATAAVAITAAVTATATAGQNRSPSASLPARREKSDVEAKTTPVWAAYSGAYFERYGTEPTRNAKVNGMLADILRRVPQEEAPQIAAFYVKSDRGLYTSAGHCVDLLDRDIEKLRTDWIRGHTPTDTEARQGDRTAATGNVFRELKDEVRNGY